MIDVYKRQAPVVPIGTASLSFRKKGEKKPSLYDYAASGILTNKDDPLNGLQSIDPFEQAQMCIRDRTSPSSRGASTPGSRFQRVFHLHRVLPAVRTNIGRSCLRLVAKERLQAATFHAVEATRIGAREGIHSGASGAACCIEMLEKNLRHKTR